MKLLSNLKEWQALNCHHTEIKNKHMRDMFYNDPDRYPRYTLTCGELLLDYSRNRINDQTIALLCELANTTHLQQKIADLFSGANINTTEKRPALHTALRDELQRPITVNGKNIALLISQTKAQMYQLSQQIHQKKWLGKTGKPIQHIINIGIGGSHLGPMMCTNALKPYNKSGLSFHFISTVDKANIHEVLQQIDLEASLFIVSSKTFTTIETLTNAQTIATLMKNKFGGDALANHFIAVTEAFDKAITFGISKEHILPMWNWVGGRYSVWSAIGLPLLLLLGEENYEAFLHGAFVMDEHFKNTPFQQNIPVILALLGIWYMNFFSTNLKAIVPYSHRLRYLVPYLQQVEMESNGKSVCLNGMPAEVATGTVVFGEEGCNGQHAYHQLLLQGQHLIPVDFILFGKNLAEAEDIHQQILIASGLSQAQALMRGKTYDEAYHELLKFKYAEEEAKLLAHHRVIPGNCPSNVLFFESLSPQNLGALLALYEHKIFVQGAIWDINSFDQWGVELGKQLLPAILQSFQQNQSAQQYDSATAGLIQHFNTLTNKN